MIVNAMEHMNTCPILTEQKKWKHSITLNAADIHKLDCSSAEAIHLILSGHETYSASHLCPLERLEKLRALKLNGNRLDEGAIQSLRRILERCKLHSLSLESTKLNPDQAATIVDALPLCRTLTSVNLSGNSITRGVIAWGDGSRMEDYEYDMTAVLALKKALPKCPALTSVNLLKTSIRENEATALCAVQAAHPNLNSLCGLESNAKELNLSGEDIGDDSILFANDLKVNWALQKITWGKSYMAALKSLACTYSSSITIDASSSVMDLSGKGLQPHDARILASMLPKCTALTSIDISDNNVDIPYNNVDYIHNKIGIDSVAAAIPSCPTLISVTVKDYAIPVKDIQTEPTIDLSNKNLDRNDVIIIAALLPLNKALTSFDISSNDNLISGDYYEERFGAAYYASTRAEECHLSCMDGVMALSEALPQCLALTTILFGGCQSERIEKDLVQGASSNVGDEVTYQGRVCVVSNGVDSHGMLKLRYPPAKLTTDMADVELSGLGLDAGGAMIAAAFLPKMPALASFNISKNVVGFVSKYIRSMAGVVALARALPRCLALASFNISGADEPREAESHLYDYVPVANTHIATALASSVPHCAALSSIQIADYTIPVRELKTKPSLGLSNKNIQAADAIIIAALLPMNKALYSLDLSDNKLTEDALETRSGQTDTWKRQDFAGIFALVEALPLCFALTSFIFSGYSDRWQHPAIPAAMVRLEVGMPEVDLSEQLLGPAGALLAVAFLPKMELFGFNRAVGFKLSNEEWRTVLDKEVLDEIEQHDFGERACLALMQLGAALDETDSRGFTPAMLAEWGEVNDSLSGLLRAGVVELGLTGPSGAVVLVWRREDLRQSRKCQRKQALAALQTEWQRHIDEWHGHATRMHMHMHMLRKRFSAMDLSQIVQHLLPPSPRQYRNNNHNSYLASCLCERRVPELRLAGCQGGGNLPLPLRASSISRACYAASLESASALKSVLRQVLLLPAVEEVEWLYNYCIFLAKQHGMASMLGVKLLRLSGPNAALQHRRQQQAREHRWREISRNRRPRRQQQQLLAAEIPLHHAERHTSAATGQTSGSMAATASLPVVSGRAVSAPASFTFV